MSLVRVEGSSKRLRQPRILSVKKFRVLLDELREPIRTMCIVAACLGLRASELVVLQWGDFDWKACEVDTQCGVVIGRVDEVKTTSMRGLRCAQRKLFLRFYFRLLDLLGNLGGSWKLRAIPSAA